MKRGIIVIIILCIALFLLIAPKIPMKFSIPLNISQKNESKEIENRTSEEISNLTKTERSFNEEKEVGEEEGVVEGGSEGGIGSSSESRQKISSEKVLSLRIFEICSGKPVENMSSMIEGGGVFCLNKEYPYYVIFEYNSTHLNSYFVNESIFNQSFERNGEILVYYLYAEDVSSIATEIDSINLYSNINNFRIGNYTLHTVWERVDGNMEITKMIVVFPLYFTQFSEVDEWTQLNFTLKTGEKEYFLGNMFVKIKEK